MRKHLFHPAVETWLKDAFAAPTPVQIRVWDALVASKHLLMAAPTGSGKTLAAFLTVIDDLVQQGLTDALPSGVQVVYVSPLKALSNDIQRNLEAPLAGIREQLALAGYGDVPIRTAVRTGDTPQAARAAMRKHPPQILVTTPESLYILLTSDSGREMLRSTRTVIVDEIHALAGSKRGAHLALSLERLARLPISRPRRIGLSATQKPLEEIAKFLVGTCDAALLSETLAIIDEGHARDRELRIELPTAPLEAVLAGDSSNEIYDRIAELIGQHKTTLVFVNTRRMAERVAKALSDRVGAEFVTSHHGSMARELRLQAEQRLKAGELRALVATASLELGIDIGEVDLVCQIGSTRSLAILLQRVGRSGHRIDALAKGRVFPQTRDELVECAALFEMTRRGELDRIEIAGPALDVLAQQIVAEVSCEEFGFEQLFELYRGAYSYRNLDLAAFEKLLVMLAEGFAFARGKRSAYVHLDQVNRRIRPRIGARLVAVTCGGAIPDSADYDVIVEPSGQFVGTVNEDFAIESLPGSIFQLGNSSWRVLKVDQAAIRVADAQGQPPNMPFWLGEAPARSFELSAAVARLRAEFDQRMDEVAPEFRRASLVSWLTDTNGLDDSSANQIYEYLASGRLALGVMPTQETLVLERFFDESGGMQLVIHSSFGSRINRAWGLALRKRFCRQFNFELQAAAVEDAIVISLGAVHSFPLEEVWKYLKSSSVREVLIQALLDAPMFTIRWRWVASCALAIQRSRNGKRIPPRLLRMNAEDLVSVVFPEQLACAENLRGAREVPDHPLVTQAINDCLIEVMDCQGLERLLGAIERGELRLVAKDLTAPSPFAQAVLNANPYAFLDDAPLEERRTQAVQSRRWLDPETAHDLGALDPAAIARVMSEVWPSPRNKDELHEALSLLVVVEPEFLAQATNLHVGEIAVDIAAWFAELVAEGRAAVGYRPNLAGSVWFAVENTGEVHSLWPGTRTDPGLTGVKSALTNQDAARQAVVRGWLDVCGPITTATLAKCIGLEMAEIDSSLLRLEAQGIVLRGAFTSSAVATEWCDRRLLARIHRYTLNRLRAEIEPVTAADFTRFLFEWQFAGAGNAVEGVASTQKILELLAGFEAPAGSWETALLPLRVRDYAGNYLDNLTTSGKICWSRLRPRNGCSPGANLSRISPITFSTRHELSTWQGFAQGSCLNALELSGPAGKLRDFLGARGASFFDDLVEGTQLLRTQCEAGLSELVTNGLVTCDSALGLRVLLTPSSKRKPFGGARRRRGPAVGIEDAGRWYSIESAERAQPSASAVIDKVEPIVRALLGRYGVVFRRVLEREGRAASWRDILYCLRRMEARGEVRGGRFVAGFSGEQFALPAAITGLRRVRSAAGTGHIDVISAADPLNMVGILSPGIKIPSASNALIAYLDGAPIATKFGSEIRFIKPLKADQEVRIRTAFIAQKSVPTHRRATFSTRR